MWSTNPWNKARPQHREFHPLLFSYFIQKDKTLLLIVIFFLTVVNLIGDSHTKEVYIFRLWGVIEMHWLNYSVPKSLLNEILQNTKSIHMWKVGKFCFFNLIAKDTVRHLYFCLETPAGRVDILLLIMNTLHTCGLLIIISLFNFSVICPFSRLRLWTAGAVVGFH